MNTSNPQAIRLLCTMENVLAPLTTTTTCGVETAQKDITVPGGTLHATSQTLMGSI